MGAVLGMRACNRKGPEFSELPPSKVIIGSKRSGRILMALKI
jgi:hypothetical protein